MSLIVLQFSPSVTFFLLGLGVFFSALFSTVFNPCTFHKITSLCRHVLYNYRFLLLVTL